MSLKTLKKIINVTGDKGGVGKSSVSSSSVDTIIYINKTVRLIEAENTNTDVGKPYMHLIPVDFLNLDSNPGFLKMLEIINACSEEYIVINNPARSINWINYGPTFCSALHEINAEMQTLWVLGRKTDSIESLLTYSDAIPNVIHPVFNLYFGSRCDYEIWDDAENIEAKEVISRRNGKEIIYPACADRVTEMMSKKRWNWSDIDKMPFAHRIEAQRFCSATRSALAPIIL